MIEIFQNKQEISVGVNKPPQWNYISTGIKENINNLEIYYKNNVRPVKNDHFLIKLLQSLPVSKTLPLYKYFDMVDSICLNHSMLHKMTSSIYKGIVHRGIFYGGVIPEILIATDEVFDIEEASINWKNVSAIKPILHPKSDFKYTLPNGVEYSKEYGLAVLVININMLAIQYRSFYLNELKLRPDNPYGISYFIAAYVLPNMLKENAELALFNRMYNKVFDIENGVTNFKHPLAIANYLPYIDKAVESTIELINKSDKNYRKIFSTLPSIYKDNMAEVLIVPKMFENRQLSWALLLSRLRMIKFLIKVSGEETYTKNNYMLTQVVRSLNRFDSFNMMRQMLPLDIYFVIEEEIDYLLDTLNKNSIK